MKKTNRAAVRAATLAAPTRRAIDSSFCGGELPSIPFPTVTRVDSDTPATKKDDDKKPSADDDKKPSPPSDDDDKESSDKSPDSEQERSAGGSLSSKVTQVDPDTGSSITVGFNQSDEDYNPLGDIADANKSS